MENLAQPAHIEWEDVWLCSKPDPLHFNWFLVYPFCSCYLLLSYKERNNLVLENKERQRKTKGRELYRGLVSSTHLHRHLGTV